MLTRRERIEQFGLFNPTTDPWGELKDLWNIVDSISVCEDECEDPVCLTVRAYIVNQAVNPVSIIIAEHFEPLGLFNIFSGENEYTIESVFSAINNVLSSKLNSGRVMTLEELSDTLNIDCDEIHLVMTRAKEAHGSWWKQLAIRVAALLKTGV